MITHVENISNKAYHYFYKITNRINGMFYYGIHSTNDLNDDYMGSGKRIRAAIKKYGVENFTKEIIKFFPTLKELSDYEQQIIDESLLNDPKCYNLVKGGYFLDGDAILKRKQTFKDKKHQQGQNNSQYGKCWITRDNKSKMVKTYELEKYLGEGWIKGRVIENKKNITIANRGRRHMWKDGKETVVNPSEVQTYLDNGWIIGRVDPMSKRKPSMTKEESIANMQKYVRVHDKDDNTFVVERTDPRYLSGELQAYNAGRIKVIDKDGNKFLISKTDPRYLSGELIKPLPKPTNKILIRNKYTNEYRMVSKDDPLINHPDYVNSTKGLKYNTAQRAKIKYIKTKNKMTWVNDGKIHKYISINDIDNFLAENPGWNKGRIKKS